MREIIFRGKRLDNGEWVYGYLIKLFSQEKERFAIDTCKQFDFEGYSLNVYEIDPSTVGQYTGLRDKNGTMVFEGDIVDFKGRPAFITIVLGEWVAMRDSGLYHKLYPEILSSVIIGNIHDNPELIKRSTE